MPPLRDVRCFVAVARRLSFSAAAAELGLSQPAVSQAVGRLERVLGVRLLERTSREVLLAGAGRALLPHAETLLADAAELTAQAARLAEPVGPRSIGLGYDPLVGTLAARVVRRMARRLPGVEVRLVPAGWATATGALVAGGGGTAATAGGPEAGGEVIAALMSTPFPTGLPTAGRFRVPVTHLAVPAGDPLAGTPRVTPRRLAHHRVLLPRARPPGSVWARLAALLPDDVPIVDGDLDDLPAALDLVAAGRGALPVPGLLAETVRRPDVDFLPLDAGGPPMTYALVWHPDRAGAAVMALVQTVQDLLRAR